MEKEIDSEYLIDDDKTLLDYDVIHDVLSSSYWSKGIPFELMKKSIDNSFCVGVYHNKAQVGFARVVTDFALSASLCDVFIIEKHRRKGLSKRLMEFIIDHPELKTIRSWRLATDDAHGLYSKFGFHISEHPEKLMERKQRVW